MIPSYLKLKARKYNPSENNADREVEQCVICLDNFGIDDGKEIAELNCNSKHIFHVLCLS